MQKALEIYRGMFSVEKSFGVSSEMKKSKSNSDAAPFNTVLSAFESFKKQEENILHLLRAADVYSLHLIANLRTQPVDTDLISKIISENKLSTLTMAWYFHLSKAEYEKLRASGEIRKICQQIVFSIYTSLECYLIDKFKEYLTHKLEGQSNEMVQAILGGINFRSLSQIKDNYSHYLSIHLPTFDPDLGLFESDWFLPKTAWEALIMLSDARNEIAHKGESTSFDIAHLIDAFSPLDFISHWVELFNCKFDDLIYEHPN